MYDLNFYYRLLFHRPEIIRIEFDCVLFSGLTAEQANSLYFNHIRIRNSIQWQHKVGCSDFFAAIINFPLNCSIDCCFYIIENIVRVF